jgi:hypothetical protein
MKDIFVVVMDMDEAVKNVAETVKGNVKSNM